MHAYDDVKVWTIESSPSVRSRPRSGLRAEGPERGLADEREREERNERLSVWARLLVVAILGAAVLWWPYPRSCGVGLAGYLAATLMIVVGGLWVVACTWVARMSRTHALAMLVALWGVGLIALEVLPRVGYAKPDPAHPAVWLCSR